MHPHSLRRHTISKDEISALPRMSYTGHIHVVDSDAKMHAAVQALRGKGSSPKGTHLNMDLSLWDLTPSSSQVPAKNITKK